MSIIQSTHPQSISSLKLISGDPAQLFLTNKLSSLSLTTPISSFKTATIRMGGGPRTYPGGVSKWQWKRMQAKKSKQLLKARLARERQIYEMRKRAELKAAVSELERPWEVVEKAPTLFSVGADEQLKVLADRFQKPGGFDMWSEKDGPELFKPHDGLPSARFFPKGVVHSIKPYGKIERIGDGMNNPDGPDPASRSGLKGEGGDDDDDLTQWRRVLSGGGNPGNSNSKELDEMSTDNGTGKSLKNNKFKKRRAKRRYSTDSVKIRSEEVALDNENGSKNSTPVHSAEVFRRHNVSEKYRNSSDADDVCDLRLQRDGRYEYLPEI